MEDPPGHRERRTLVPGRKSRGADTEENLWKEVTVEQLSGSVPVHSVQCKPSKRQRTGQSLKGRSSAC